MVQDTPQLNSMLESVTYPTEGNVLLRSKSYLQLGCDLRDLDTLDKFIKSEFDISQTSIFCTAEVSIAYMDVKSSDSLIQYFGQLPDGT